MPTVLVTGANRGIGLEFARQYSDAGWNLIATAREPEKADELDAVANGGGDVRVLPLDVCDPTSIDALVGELDGQPLDLFVNNAGVMGPIAPERDGWLDTLAVNAVAPTLLALNLAPNLKAGANAKAIAITSRMGSIGDNESGGFYAYRSSKAALNAAWKSLSHEFRPDGIAVAVLHPGWVQTDMGGSSAQIDAATSVKGMIGVIERLSMQETGSFYNYEGSELLW